EALLRQGQNRGLRLRLGFRSRNGCGRARDRGRHRDRDRPLGGAGAATAAPCEPKRHEQGGVSDHWPGHLLHCRLRKREVLAGLAEREGFEPSRELVAPYSLSRRVPSATRPPLRGTGARRAAAGASILDTDTLAAS